MKKKTYVKFFIGLFIIIVVFCIIKAILKNVFPGISSYEEIVNGAAAFIGGLYGAFFMQFQSKQKQSENEN